MGGTAKGADGPGRQVKLEAPYPKLVEMSPLDSADATSGAEGVAI